MLYRHGKSYRFAAVSAALLYMVPVVAVPAAAQVVTPQVQSAASLAVVMDFLSNTAPDKVEAAAQRLVAPDATYVSLNFDNPELKQIEPWAGTAKGPSAYSSVFLRVADYWKIEDFTVADKFASGEDVAIFGKFTYRSVEVGHVFTSPFSIHAKVRNGKMVYFQFMEDTYASASSFRQSGSWTVKTTKATAPFKDGGKEQIMLGGEIGSIYPRSVSIYPPKRSRFLRLQVRVTTGDRNR